MHKKSGPEKLFQNPITLGVTLETSEAEDITLYGKEERIPRSQYLRNIVIKTFSSQKDESLAK